VKGLKKTPRALLAAWIGLVLVLGGLLSGCSRKSVPMTESSKVEPIIALFTDFGSKDAYVAELKGAIYSVHPEARVVDLLHEVTPFSIQEGAYLLAQSAREFPQGTILVAIVDPGVGSPREPLLLLTKKGKFFIGPNNGLFSLVLEEEGLDRAWVLDKPQYYRKGRVSSTFHGRDIFGPIAAHLARGVSPDSLGSPTRKVEQLSLRAPNLAGQAVSGEVLHVDRFGNVITNIPRGYAPFLQEGTLLRITLGSRSFSAPLVRSYSELPQGKLGALFNSSDLLELVYNQGPATRLLRAEPGTPVLVRP
jgi:S-adenosylmethionine hydrolase